MVRKNKATFNFFGFEIKYCTPNDLSGNKSIHHAKIYYDGIFFMSYDIQKNAGGNSITTTFADDGTYALMMGIVSMISEKTGGRVKSDFGGFLAQLLDAYMVFQLYRHYTSNKLGYDGVFVFYDDDYNYKYCVPSEVMTIKTEDKVLEAFSGLNDYYISCDDGFTLLGDVFGGKNIVVDMPVI